MKKFTYFWRFSKIWKYISVTNTLRYNWSFFSVLMEILLFLTPGCEKKIKKILASLPSPASPPFFLPLFLPVFLLSPGRLPLVLSAGLRLKVSIVFIVSIVQTDIFLLSPAALLWARSERELSCKVNLKWNQCQSDWKCSCRSFDILALWWCIYEHLLQAAGAWVLLKESCFLSRHHLRR